MADPVVVGATIASIVFLARRLAETRLRRVGSALLVIVLGAVAGNLGLVPSEASFPLYAGIFGYVAPLSIFWLLLPLDLRHVLRAGAPILGAFGLGAAGTTAGALLGTTLAGGASAFGETHAALAGMFAGTYVGGSINFNAVALEYGLVTDGGLYAGAVAVDNIFTAIWMMVCLATPRLLAPLWKRGARGSSPRLEPGLDLGDEGADFDPDPAVPADGVDLDPDPAVPVDLDVERIGPRELAALLALGLLALGLEGAIGAALSTLGLDVPGMLILTALALALGTLPGIRRLSGAHALGVFAVEVFLTVIGALCSLAALAQIGELGPRLVALAGTTVLVHGVVSLTGARLLGIDPGVAAVASQANVGGGTTALAVARTIGRPDLAVPGILVGSLGTALGTFVGFAVAALLTSG